jgi:hypothetical protein
LHKDEQSGKSSRENRDYDQNNDDDEEDEDDDSDFDASKYDLEPVVAKKTDNKK